MEGHLCQFVGKPMMKVFKPALRRNRMGLDYDKIITSLKTPRLVRKDNMLITSGAAEESMRANGSFLCTMIS